MNVDMPCVTWVVLEHRLPVWGPPYSRAPKIKGPARDPNVQNYPLFKTTKYTLGVLGLRASPEPSSIRLPEGNANCRNLNLVRTLSTTTTPPPVPNPKP